MVFVLEWRTQFKIRARPTLLLPGTSGLCAASIARQRAVGEGQALRTGFRQSRPVDRTRVTVNGLQGTDCTDWRVICAIRSQNPLTVVLANSASATLTEPCPS